MTSKIRIKLGTLEVDYEGGDDFIKQQLPELLKTLQDFHANDDTSTAAGNGSESHISRKSSTPDRQMSTNTVAHKLSSKSGSDLVRSAAARLGIVLQKETFTRKELLDEMKSATSYYKASMRNNLDNYIKTVLDGGTLLLQSDGTYSIAAGKRTELEQKLA